MKQQPQNFSKKKNFGSRKTIKVFLGNKRGVSGVVTVVILIALVIAMAAVVWTVVDKLVKEKLQSAQSCMDIYDKVTLNRVYTCYNKTATELHVSINIGDIEVEKLVVSTSGGGTTKSFKIPADDSTKQYVKNLGDADYGGGVNLPEKNAGLTYVTNISKIGFANMPDSVSIAPVIDGEQCRVVDSVAGFDPCDISV